VARRWLFALTLLAGLSWATLGVARAADENADPLAKYLALIDTVRANLNGTVDRRRSRQIPRLAEAATTP
jgi:hypothetical protein